MGASLVEWGSVKVPASVVVWVEVPAYVDPPVSALACFKRTVAGK